jgi:hypothetical protein
VRTVRQSGKKTEKGRKRGMGQYRRLFEVLKKCGLHRVWEFNFVSTYSTYRPLGKTEENTIYKENEYSR